MGDFVPDGFDAVEQLRQKRLWRFGFDDRDNAPLLAHDPNLSDKDHSG